MSEGWPLRMGKYEFDGYRHGKASFRKPGTKDWNLIVWHPEGRWELATHPDNGMPLYVSTSRSNPPHLPPSNGWAFHKNRHAQGVSRRTVRKLIPVLKVLGTCPPPPAPNGLPEGPAPAPAPNGLPEGPAPEPAPNGIPEGLAPSPSVVQAEVISTSSQLTLYETCDLLRHQLGLAQAPMKDTLAAACEALGVSQEGTVVEQADRCRAALGC